MESYEGSRVTVCPFSFTPLKLPVFGREKALACSCMGPKTKPGRYLIDKGLNKCSSCSLGVRVEPVPALDCAHSLTVVQDQPVLPAQAQLLLPLPHQFLHIGRQAVGITGEDEGVAVSTGPVQVEEAAGVLQGECVVVCVDDPVVIICKPQRPRWP